jgi:hypothetical protein
MLLGNNSGASATATTCATVAATAAATGSSYHIKSLSQEDLRIEHRVILLVFSEL